MNFKNVRWKFAFLSVTICLLIAKISFCYADTLLTDDFRPAVGKSTANPIGGYRLVLANSPDGLNWTRTNLVLADRASVADAVITSSGRIIVYYVTGGKIVDGTEIIANDIVAAVSDDGGSSWIYKDITFSGEPSGGTKPVDPNVVLMADGSISMFVTIDPDQSGSQKPQTYSSLSTDGGFTYTVGSKIFSVTGGDVLDPENYRYSDNRWRIYCGGTPGTTRTALSTDDGITFNDEGTFTTQTDDSGTDSFIVADVTNISDTIYRIYMFGLIGTANGIRSMYSIDSGITWTVDSGDRLTVNASTGVESGKVWAPTVIRKTDGNYLMVFETEIPSTASTTISYIDISSGKTLIEEAETTVLALRSVYQDSTKRDITRIAAWSSSNSSVATVSSTGVVTAVSPGISVITASYSTFTDTLAVTVEYESSAPVITTLTISDAYQGAAYCDTLEFVDSDNGDTINFIKVSGPEWLAVSSAGILSGTPSNGDVGSDFPVLFTATDSYGLADTLSTTIDVINVIEPPSALVVSDSPSDNGHKLQLSWTLSTDDEAGFVDKYRIYRSRNGELTESISLANLSSLDSLLYYEQYYTVLIDSVNAGINEYLDTGVPLNSVVYYYWVEAVGAGGASQKIRNSEALSVDKNDTSPAQFELLNPFPNPFNPATTISFNLPADTRIKLKIYSVSGQLVDTLADGFFGTGSYSFKWDAGYVSSGVYLCTLETNNSIKTKKITLLK